MMDDSEFVALWDDLTPEDRAYFLRRYPPLYMSVARNVQRAQIRLRRRAQRRRVFRRLLGWRA